MKVKDVIEKLNGLNPEAAFNVIVGCYPYEITPKDFSFGGGSDGGSDYTSVSIYIDKLNQSEKLDNDSIDLKERIQQAKRRKEDREKKLILNDKTDFDYL